MKFANPKAFLQILLKTVALYCFTFTCFTGFSNHFLAMEITYKRVDSLKYDVNLVYYRDCRSNPTSAPTLYINCGSYSESLGLKIQKYEDITNVCYKSKDPCTPANTRASYGLEKQTYTAVLDLQKSRFKNLLNCGKLRLNAGICCRDGSINTGPTGNYYTYSTLDVKAAEKNSSPIIQIDPYLTFCLNQPVYMTFGAIDSDGDSLSYEFDHPLRAHGGPISFTSPRSYKKPFKFYDPAGTGYTNHLSYPPIGIYLSPTDGEFVYTPTTTDVGPMVVLIKEWRKIGGVYKEIGSIRRDFHYSTTNCAGNNPPQIRSPKTYNLCYGDSIEIEIASRDKPKVIPPNPAPASDTTTFNWYTDIKGISITHKNTNAINDTLIIKWKPSISDFERSQRFVFLKLEDNTCPINTTTGHSLVFNMKKGYHAKRTIDSLNCGKYAISTKIDSNIKGNTRILHSLKTVGGLENDKAQFARFGNGNFNSSSAIDTITFSTADTFILKTEVFVDAGYCSSVLNDTFILRPFKPVLTLPKDKSLCCDTGVINLNLEVNPVGGKWTCSKNQSLLLNGYEFDSKSACTNSSKVYTLAYEYTSKTNGCTNQDSFNITLNPLPRLELIDDTFCQSKGTVDLSELLLLPARLSGTNFYVNCIDCGTSDPKKIINETGNPPFDKDYHFDISKNVIDLKKIERTTLRLGLKYFDSRGCASRDTTRITVISEPEINLDQFDKFCWDVGKIDLKQNAKVIPRSGYWTCYDTTLALPGFRNCKDPLMKGALDTNKYAGDTLDTKKTIASGGKYYMRYIVDSTGCTVYKDAFLDINPLPKPRIDKSVIDKSLANHTPPPYLLCSSDLNISMLAAPGGGTWSSNRSGVMNGNIFKPSAVGDENPLRIIYKYTDINGCKNADSVSVQIEKSPTITRIGDSLVASIGTGYQWLFNGEKLNSERKRYLIVKKKGSYQVEVDQKCGTNITDVMSINSLTITPKKKVQINLYPNPAKDKVQIVFSKPINGTICIFDITGKIVYKAEIKSDKLSLNTKKYPRGVYWLEVESNKDTIRKKLVLK